MTKKIAVCLIIFCLDLTVFSAESPTKESKAALVASGLSAENELNYVIGPEDVLKIDVWKEPELSGSVPVRPDGKISLPLLDDLQAAGLTPMQLAAEITEKLTKFVTEPRVTVVVSSAFSHRVFIMGEVAHAGAFALLPQMTVLQAVSTAGGFSPYANRKKIYILRNDNGTQRKYPFNYKEVIKGKNTQQNILLKPGDTIVVP